MGLTEHPAVDGHRAMVLVNYTPEERTVTVSLAGWQVRYFQYFTTGTVTKGTDTLTVTLPGNTGAAVLLDR